MLFYHYAIFLLHVLDCFSFFQKRDSGLTTLTSSDGDKSSVTKSYTTPSTPQAESVNFPSEPGISNSIIPESIPPDDLLDVVHDRELHADDLSFQETPLVCNESNYPISCLLIWLL